MGMIEFFWEFLDSSLNVSIEYFELFDFKNCNLEIKLFYLYYEKLSLDLK